MGVNISQTNNVANGVTMDLANLPDGTFDVQVIPRDIAPTVNFTAIGDPATSPPNRLWMPYLATITKTGNTFTSTDPRVSINNRDITIRLHPIWMLIAANRPRGAHVPSVIIIHHTDDENHSGVYDPNFHSRINSGIRTWRGNGLAPHYVIDRDGSVVKLGHESRQAFHADPARWDGQRFVNQFSIGIEIVHTNNPHNNVPTYTEDFTPEQYTSLISLLNDLTGTFNIPVYSIVGHSDVAISGTSHILGRKSTDPGIQFDWTILEAAGLGLQRMIGPIDFSVIYGGFFNAHPGGRIRNGAPGVTPSIVQELKADLTRIGYSVTNNNNYDNSVERAIMVFCEHFLALDGQDSVNMATAEVIKRVVGFLADVKP
jgi:N-acetyl-anhydromuramyl-L-alanine amidase AmpD